MRKSTAYYIYYIADNYHIKKSWRVSEIIKKPCRQENSHHWWCGLGPIKHSGPENIVTFRQPSHLKIGKYYLIRHKMYFYFGFIVPSWQKSSCKRALKSLMEKILLLSHTDIIPEKRPTLYSFWSEENFVFQIRHYQELWAMTMLLIEDSGDFQKCNI